MKKQLATVFGATLLLVAPAGSRTPDTVLINGRIVTVDD
jgi:hypothetical protein